MKVSEAWVVQPNGGSMPRAITSRFGDGLYFASTMGPILRVVTPIGTIFAHPGDTVELDEHGNLWVAKAGRAALEKD